MKVGRASKLALGCKASLAAALVIGGVSCGGGTAGAQGSPTNTPGTYASDSTGQHYFTDSNERGRASELVIQNMYWGRMVDVFGLNPQGEKVPMQSDMVIGKGVQSNGIDYDLTTNPVTAVQELTILRDVTDTGIAGGFEQFESLLRQTQTSLDPVDQQGPSSSTGGSAGLYTMVPRNAALVVVFNDLLAPDSIDVDTIRMHTGTNLSTPFELRVVPDTNFGDVADLDGQPGSEYYSTRVILDPTISIIESFGIASSFPVNSQGYPASTNVILANLLLRIPTLENGSLGQYKVLENPTGHGLDVTQNGAWDPNGTQDIFRAMRSGGSTAVTGDTYNGFLLDNQAPEVVGSSAVVIVDAPIQNGFYPNEFVLPNVTFDSNHCARLPQAGDVIAQIAEGIFADVLGAQVLNGREVVNLRVRLRQYPVSWSGPEQWVLEAQGVAEFQSAFDSIADAGRVGCFVHISPLPSGYPDQPVFGVDPNSTFQLRFSEPMDRSSVTAFDSMLLTREELNPANDPPLSTSSFVVGEVGLAPDLQRFTYNPDFPLNHEEGTAEEYFLSMLIGGLGATDLAGNGLGGNFPAIPFHLDAAKASTRNGGRVSRFSGLDEEPEHPGNVPSDYGIMPEWGGQHLFDLGQEHIFPRPVTRYTVVADRSQAVPAMMVPFSVGIQTPLSNLGSKMQTVYRFVDVGWTLEDAATANMDVTGIAWAPVDGLVTFDTYSEFEVRMNHSRYAPDEFIDPANLWPKWPSSGLQASYTANFLDGVADPQRVMHSRELGYQVDPGTVFTVGGGTTKFVRFPMNQNLTNPNDELTYTWRDTSLLHRAGPFNGGAPPDQQMLALGLDPETDIMRTSNIRTVGLPLLVEFRCYPDSAASGLNGFDINLAANSSSQPYMRAFSTGGYNSSGNANTIDPDASQTASGGFNPNANGQATPGLDNSFYLGAIDLVVRVSRSFSIWFPADDPSNPGNQLANAQFSPAVMEPRLVDQPPGTTIEVDY
ncbi:MAG: Ig-like domain-containing protein, partial [bacterium]|nr:Ig-like domain-containing protein [bacterium]